MKVTFSATHSVFAVKAPKDTLVSLSETPTQVEDGVYKIGDSGVVLIDEQHQTDSIYLSTAGNDYTVARGERIATVAEGVEVWAGSSGVSCPFVKSGKGGGGSSGGCNYKGTTTTAISNGSTINPITIDGESYTAAFGDIVVYGYTEFVFDGTTWSEFGRPFDTTPTAGSANAVTSDGIYKVTPLQKGSGEGSVCGLQSQNIASGLNAFAGGTASKATARDAIAYGYYTNATGTYSSAFGYNTRAKGTHSCVVGKNNLYKNGDIFEVGNGSTIEDLSNILEANSTSVNVNGDIQKNNVSLPTPYTTMPTITEAMLGQIAMYVGATDSTYTQGYFYIASSDGAAEPTYSWVNLPVSPRTYSETVLYSANAPHKNDIELSQAYTNFDEIVIIWKYSSPDPDTVDNYSVRYTKTYKVSTFGDSVVFLCGEETSATQVFTAYVLNDTTHINYNSSIGTLYNWIAKVIGIKY